MALTWMMFLHDTWMRFIPGRLACAYNEEKLLPDVVYYNTNLSFTFDFIKRNVYFNIMLLLLKEWQKKSWNFQHLRRVAEPHKLLADLWNIVRL